MRVAQQTPSQAGYEVEDVISHTGSQHEQRNDELHEHAHNDGMPLDVRTMLACHPQRTNKYQQSKERHCTVIAGVVQRFFGHKGTDEDNSDSKGACNCSSEFRRDQRDDAPGGDLPDRLHGLEEDADGDPQEDEAEGYAKPEKERNDPVFVVPVENQRCDPPSSRRSSLGSNLLRPYPSTFKMPNDDQMPIVCKGGGLE